VPFIRSAFAAAGLLEQMSIIREQAITDGLA